MPPTDTSSLSRLERIMLELLLVEIRTDTVESKALRLSRLGLSNAEIAILLGTSAASVAQSLYMARTKVKSGSRLANSDKRSKKVTGKKAD